MDSRIAGFVRRRPLLSYFALSFAVPWALWAVLIASGRALNPVFGAALLFLGVAAPSASALALAWLAGGGRGLGDLAASVLRWKVAPRWYLAAVLGPIAVMLLAVALNAILGGSVPNPSAFWRLLLIVPAFAAILFFLGPLEQELGWRGYALPMLQSRHSALFSALAVGLLWGLWHLPLFWAPGTPQYSSIQENPSAPWLIAVAVLYDTSLSVLFAWLYNSSGGSTLIAVLFHASIDTALVVPMLLGLTSGSLTGNSSIFLLFLGLVFLWIAAVLLSVGPARLSRTRSPGSLKPRALARRA